MNQTRLGSLFEAIVNVLIGYGIAVATQIAIFPWFGIHIPTSTNFAMGGVFTVISIARSYLTRRYFNAALRRAAGNLASAIAKS